MEMYADIAHGYKFTQHILQGKWPLYFILGNGPLFFYIVAAIASIFGLSFLTMKITSVIVGLGIVVGVYYLGRKIFNCRIGLIAAFLVGVSKWSLIFSRIGNMNILVPLIVVINLLIFFKILRDPSNFKLWLILGAFLGLGVYSYPAYLIFPFGIGVLFLLQGPKFLKQNLLHFLLMGIVFLLISSYFFNMFFGSLSSYTSSSNYFGGKIFVSGGKLRSDWVQRLFLNIKKTLLMFHVRGAPSFRVNIPNSPMLDPISGLFLLIGILTVIFRKNKIGLQILGIGFLLTIPSILVLNVPTAVPSASRTIGIFPLVYLLIAVGIDQLWRMIKSWKREFRIVILLLTFVGIAGFNLKNYFVDYPFYLPNHNMGFPKLIAKKVDKLSNDTIVYMIGGEWGEWGNPDRRSVRYELTKPKSFTHLKAGEFECSLIKDNKKPMYFIIDPNLKTDLKEVKSCFPEGSEKIHKTPKYDFKLFTSYSVRG